MPLVSYARPLSLSNPMPLFGRGGGQGHGQQFAAGLAASQGYGGTAEQLAYQASRFFPALTDPLGLATFAAGSLAFGLSRWAAVRGLGQWAPRLWRARPLASQLGAAMVGYGAETAAFALFPRGLAWALGMERKGGEFGQDLARTALLLGMLRASGPAGRILAMGRRGGMVQGLAMGSALYGNALVEEGLGWRRDLGWENRLKDSLSTFFQFQAAGAVVRRLLGGGYQQIQAQWEREIREISKGWFDGRPLAVRPEGWAYAGARLKSGRPDHLWFNEGLKDEESPPPRTRQSSDPPPPETIHFELIPDMLLGNGHYRVKRKLGEGGMGEVWELHDLLLDRPVVLKIPHPQWRRELLPRFETEYLLQAHLPKEWRVEIYEILQVTKGLKCPVMEYVKGNDLDSIVYWLSLDFARGNQIYPIETRIEIMAEVAKAVHSLHETGILHRDLKPSNIRLAAGDKVRILDYGVASYLRDASLAEKTTTIPPRVVEDMEIHHSLEGNYVGTPGWVAPEVVNGSLPNARTRDVFSLGVVLYEMITGFHPLAEYRKGLKSKGEPPLVPVLDAGDTIIREHRVLDLLHGLEPPAFNDLNPQLDGPIYQQLEKVVRRAMSPDLNERYPTAEALRHALLMVEPKLRWDALEDLRQEIQEIETQLQDFGPTFVRSEEGSPEQTQSFSQLEQRARYLRETWWVGGENLVGHLNSLTRGENFPAAQHMIAKVSWQQLSEGGSRLHPVRRTTLMERVRENDVTYHGYPRGVMALSLGLGVPVKIQIRSLAGDGKPIPEVRWKIIRLVPEKDDYGDETGNFVTKSEITIDPKGILPALEQGYYVFQFQAPGYAPMRIPLHLDYKRIKAALERDEAVHFEFEMVPESMVPEDMVVIHRGKGIIGHNFYLDGDTASANSFPQQSLVYPTFAVSRDPVKVGEYRAFISDLLRENNETSQGNFSQFRKQLAFIETLLPRTTLPAEARGGRRKVKGMMQRALSGREITYYWDLVRERGFLGMGPTERVSLKDLSVQLDPFGEPIHSEHPISAIPYRAAEAYRDWRTRRDGRDYQILDADLKEIIARNSLDVRYPWGNGPLSSRYVVSRDAFEDVSRATPQPVGTHPMGPEYYRDQSLFGVRDVIGNVREVTSTPGEKDHVCLSGGCVRMYPGANFNPSSRYQLHKNAVIDSDGAFRLMLRFPKKS